MSRILLAWEFGGGTGHVNRLRPIAEALGRKGHRVVLALHDLNAAQAAGLPDRMAGIDFAICQAPHWEPRYVDKNMPGSRHTLADGLWIYGYQMPALLSAVAQSWRQLLDQEVPDLVVADFSPSLRLVLEDRAPLLVVGSGYTVPPPGQRLPSARPWEDSLPPASAEVEERIFRTVRDVASPAGLRGIQHLSDLFSGTRTFVCSIPEFDPYAAYRREPTYDPFNLPSFGQVSPVEARPAKRAFVYLPGNHAGLSTLLAAARETGITGGAYIPSLPEPLRARFSGPQFSFFDAPQPYGEVLREARLLIHHGGSATTYAGLVSGTPQLILPSFVEQMVNARGAALLGAAVVVGGRPQCDAATMTGILRKMADQQSMWHAAQAAAGRMAARRRAESLPAILAACDELLAA